MYIWTEYVFHLIFIYLVGFIKVQSGRRSNLDLTLADFFLMVKCLQEIVERLLRLDWRWVRTEVHTDPKGFLSLQSVHKYFFDTSKQRHDETITGRRRSGGNRVGTIPR